PLLGASDYLNFVGLMMLGFGLTFELPLLLLFLGLVGVVSVDQLRSQRRAAVVVITIIGAVVTPSQDPYTMLVLAIPLYLLYELTILILRLLRRNRPEEPADI
ncbi:MAG: twin-arginine translocase subunit TatC, partial [Actinomycetota bacterium]